jgi:hypothetical protein
MKRKNVPFWMVLVLLVIILGIIISVDFGFFQTKKTVFPEDPVIHSLTPKSIPHTEKSEGSIFLPLIVIS